MSSPMRRGSGDIFASPTASSPSSQFPFPQQETLQRPTSRTIAAIRRESIASSVGSIGGVLDTVQTGRGTIPESDQNAIATLLQSFQSPMGQTSLSTYGFKAPTTRDIPPVALTNIPHIEAKVFQSYLSQVGSIYDAFQRAKENGEGDSLLFRKETKGDDWEHILSARLQRPSHSRSGSLASLPSPLEAPQPRKRPAGPRRLNTVTPLSTIPSVYSEDDFHLENPRTFDIVSERSELVRDPNKNMDAPSGRKALATNAILQEKLSWYMDTVEIHLIASISTASKSFFSTLGSLRDLHSEAAESVERIQSLRKDLTKLDKEMALGGLKIVHLKQRRENVRRLREAMAQLEEIVSSITSCEEMVEKDQIESALDDVDNVEKLIMGDESVRDEKPLSTILKMPELRDLSGIRALDGVSDHLNEIRFRIGRGYELRFLDSLLGDFRRHVESVPPDVTLQRWGSAFNRNRPRERRAPSTFPAYMSLDHSFRKKLQSEFDGLSRARHVKPAATAYKASLLREMKNLIRKQLPSSSDDDNESAISASTHGGRPMSQQEKSSILARNLRALEPEDAQVMLTKIYTGISEGLRRLSVQIKILLDITSGLSPPGSGGLRSPLRPPNIGSLDGQLGPVPPKQNMPTITVQPDMQQALDMSSLLGEAVDIVQGQITKVVKVRSEQTAQLPLTDFIRFFSLNRLFADECEAISGRGGMSLKSVIDGQIKDFVSQFSSSQIHSLVEVMDSDKWEAKDFGEMENAMLARVLDASTQDAQPWCETSMIWVSEVDGAISINGKLPNGNSAATPGRVRSAVIDEQRFILPDSAIAILRTIESFQHLTTGIPSMGQELALKLLECLKLFNSRTSQLILGAGATRSAGLKNITTKHLALSAQALSFIVAMIPYVREFFRRHLPPAYSAQTMGEFDKVKRLYQEHQNGIHEKLVDIMSSRASIHVNAMKKIDWEKAAQLKTPATSQYMEVLVKETSTLYKVLAKHLPEMTVSAIMQPVFQSYGEQWSNAYQEVPIRSVAAKERMLADAEYFNSRIGKLDGGGGLGQHVLNIVKAKPIISEPSVPKPPPPPPPAEKSGQEQNNGIAPPSNEAASQGDKSGD